MAVKDIDPVAVKEAVKRGQLAVLIRFNYNLFREPDSIQVLLKDTTAGDTVMLKEFTNEGIKECIKEWMWNPGLKSV